jgi:excisionase family DNA binding protein
MSDTTLPRLSWTTHEAAERLGLSYRALMGLVRSGRIEAVKAGKGYLIPVDALNKFLSTATAEKKAS